MVYPQLCVCLCETERAVPALVEGVDVDAVVLVFLQDLPCVVVRVEGVHENEWHVGVEGFVQMLKRRTTELSSS